MIKITEAAAKQIIEAAKQEGMEDMALRLAARRKDDGSFDYMMGFDHPGEEDITITDNEAQIILSEENDAMLDGTTVDYVEMVEGKFHFIFLNPNDANYSPPIES